MVWAGVVEHGSPGGLLEDGALDGLLDDDESGTDDASTLGEDDDEGRRFLTVRLRWRRRRGRARTSLRKTANLPLDPTPIPDPLATHLLNTHDPPSPLQTYPSAGFAIVNRTSTTMVNGASPKSVDPPPKPPSPCFLPRPAIPQSDLRITRALRVLVLSTRIPLVDQRPHDLPVHKPIQLCRAPINPSLTKRSARAGDPGELTPVERAGDALAEVVTLDLAGGGRVAELAPGHRSVDLVEGVGEQDKGGDYAGTQGAEQDGGLVPDLRLLGRGRTLPAVRLLPWQRWARRLAGRSLWPRC